MKLFLEALEDLDFKRIPQNHFPISLYKMSINFIKPIKRSDFHGSYFLKSTSVYITFLIHRYCYTFKKHFNTCMQPVSLQSILEMIKDDVKQTLYLWYSWNNVHNISWSLAFLIDFVSGWPQYLDKKVQWYMDSFPACYNYMVLAVEL